jgi:sarcosine/dimethylglycine N-methyltransferase
MINSEASSEFSSPELALEKQKYNSNPLKDRSTDHYRNEYISEFVDKWDSLIDWEGRAKGEGDFFVDVLRSRGKQTVLDVATGTGFHSVRLIEEGFDVTSADGSGAMLAKAFQNAQERGLTLKTLRADWRWLGRSTESRYDAIICLGNSFTHLHDELDRRRVLAEFYAALKPNGILIIDQRNYDYMLDSGYSSKHKYYYCGNQVSAKPIHIAEDLVRFEYSFPDDTSYTLNLCPIRKNYMRKLLREGGFERIRTYGDFESAYSDKDADFFVHVAEKSVLTPSVPMPINQSIRSLAVTEDYYNSNDADTFYSTIWGGEDLHLGIYDDTNDVKDAGFATIDRMCSILPELNADSKVIDLGSGYGGTGRYLANKFNCRVTGLNLSDTQNDRNRLMVKRANLQDNITVTHGNFEDIPAANDSFDIVWSQDAFLHSDAREKILAESFRVLKNGGTMIFTDPMQADICPEGVLQPIYDRLHLTSLASFSSYIELAKLIGFEVEETIDLSAQLPKHFSRIKEELIANREKVAEGASEEYIENMLRGLDRWIDGGEQGYLAWGIIKLKKPANS